MGLFSALDSMAKGALGQEGYKHSTFLQVLNAATLFYDSTQQQ